MSRYRSHSGEELNQEIVVISSDEEEVGDSLPPPPAKGPSPCLRCNSADQVVVLDQLICFCSNNYQPAYQENHHHRRGDRYQADMRIGHPGQLYNFLKQCREWVHVWDPRGIAPPNGEFSLSTYNILSQNLLLCHPMLYRANKSSDLTWRERSERLRKELLEMNSDIFCLQEVHHEHFKTCILPSLEQNGYQAVFKRKTGAGLDGCSILFKTNKFKLADYRNVEYNRRDISPLLDKENVGLLVKLTPIGLTQNADTKLIVANTHLLFNPKRGDIKLAQLRLLFAEIQRFAQTGHHHSNNNNNGVEDPYHLPYSPVIFCGDMNSQPGSPLVNFIQNGAANFEGLRSGDISGQRDGAGRGRDMSRHDLQLRGISMNSVYEDDRHQHQQADMVARHVFNLKSTYPSIDKNEQRLISFATSDEIGLVDHIFYSFKHPNLRLSGFQQLLNEHNFKKVGTLPNSVLGSDHLSLSAKFFIL